MGDPGPPGGRIGRTGRAGVFMLEGRMVDRPVMEQARQIYEAARRYEQEPAPPRVASARPEGGSGRTGENR